VLLDYVKGKITGAMTARVRYLQKEASAVQSRQQRVYEHDLRHEEQIKLAGGNVFQCVQSTLDASRIVPLLTR
jgi:hypothetical protein